MKNLLITVLSFCSFATFAQNGFFLQPEIGAGITNAYATVPNNGGWYYQRYPPQSYFTYNGQIGIGYQFENLSISSGVYFLRSGYKAHYRGGDLLLIDTKQTIYDYHFLIPIIVAYQFNIGDHFFLTPGIGCAVSYNSSVKVIQNENGYVSEQKITGSAFDNEFTRTSFWGIMQARFGYKLNNRLDIIAGPEAQYMITSILKNTNADNYQRNYAYSFNAGIMWHFTKIAKTQSLNPAN